MPNILFASNSVSHFPGTTIAADSWSFDSARVPYSLRTPLETLCSSPNFEASASGETWFHFRHGSTQFYVNNDEPICEIVDIDGVRILALSMYDRSGEGYHLRLNIDGNTPTYQRYAPILEEALRTYDVKVGLTGLTADIQVFVNEMRIFSYQFPISSFKLPRALWIGGSQGGGGGEGQGYYSELIIADGDTRNARLDLLRPIAAGAYGNWDGPIASLSDDDPTTGMTTTLADQNQSTILSPYGGANNISNIVQVTTSVRGINSPSKLQHLVRMSAVDYLTSSFDVPYEKDYQITDWGQNPATSAPWAAADLTTAEFGFKSIA